MRRHVQCSRFESVARTLAATSAAQWNMAGRVEPAGVRIVCRPEVGLDLTSPRSLAVIRPERVGPMVRRLGNAWKWCILDPTVWFVQETTQRWRMRKRERRLLDRACACGGGRVSSLGRPKICAYRLANSYVSMIRNVHRTTCVCRAQIAARKSPFVRAAGGQHSCRCKEEVRGGADTRAR